MKAVRLYDINDLRYEEVTIPELKNDELLLKIDACGICGSDLPRVFDMGAHVMPLIIGHEFAGTVVKTAKKEDEHLISKTAAVFPLIPCRECESCESGHYAQCKNYNYLGSRCDGGFAEYCIIPSKWQLIFSSNPDVSSEDLCMVEPATVAQHAVRKSGLEAGQTILIVGAGPIGMIAARWASIFGAKQVVLVDINEEKTEFARNLGFEVYNSRETDVVKTVMELTQNKGVDVVIEGSGSSAGLNQAIEVVKTFGTIILMGNPHQDTTIKLKNHSQILRKELSLIGVWNSNYSDYPINEWKYTVEMLDQGKLKVDDLITHKTNLENLAGLFQDIHDSKITICKAIYSAEV